MTSADWQGFKAKNSTTIFYLLFLFLYLILKTASFIQRKNISMEQLAHFRAFHIPLEKPDNERAVRHQSWAILKETETSCSRKHGMSHISGLTRMV